MVRAGAGRWTPVAIAAGAFVLVVGVGLAFTSNDGDDDPSAADTTLLSNGAISIVDPNATTTTIPVATTDPSATTVVDNSVPKVPLTRTLSNGLVGEDVKACSSGSRTSPSIPARSTATTATTPSRPSGRSRRW